MQSNKEVVSRKKEHVELCLTEDVSFRKKTSGFENYEFQYNALPELNLEDVDCSTVYLDKKLSQPLMISCMTGGYADAEKINRELAEVCEAEQLLMGVGSQRQAMLSDEFHSSFSVVREVAPSISIVANIGAAEVARQPGIDSIRKLIDLIKADALAVHLNPLQELLQPGGTPSFRGVLSGIEMLTKSLDVPLIVKEVGAGISYQVAKRLLSAGVHTIDVAGAGGTSWAGVELLRSQNETLAELWDFGIPTAVCLQEIRKLREDFSFSLIASGGVRNGFDVAKSIGLGANLASAARPFLKELMELGQKALQQKIQDWKLQLGATMFLTGSRTLADLAAAPLRRLHNDL